MKCKWIWGDGTMQNNGGGDAGKYLKAARPTTATAVLRKRPKLLADLAISKQLVDLNLGISLAMIDPAALQMPKAYLQVSAKLAPRL